MLFFFILLASFFLVRPVYADYVLPYPSYMPGNKLYRVSRVIDVLKKKWYFGSIASFRYHLELSDKYLVEAKTLFEYKQYSLAVDALKRSDVQFSEVIKFHARAQAEGKDITPLTVRLTDASLKHKEVLDRLSAELPSEFTWTPEKQQPTLLPLKELLTQSIGVRKTTLEQIK